jgi:hypothetical protein
VSFRTRWDYHRREPQDLREAVRMVRRAYADEVPPKLHEGYDSIGPDGTPKMTAKAEGYIFGSAQGSDATSGKCNCPYEAGVRRMLYNTRTMKQAEDALASVADVQHADDCPANPRNAPLVSYYHAPFRAKLDEWQRGDEGSRKRAAIISHVTIGQQGPREAAITEGVPSWCAKTVAEDAIRAFLRSMTDLKLHIQNRHAEMAGTAA